ncbi:hypothetical protein BDZ89DRAFT_1168762 [Hymenopellis radicata]|nr:hypothetical protein BDZ89DRAFT_1168762 [Hymenopellis radicata]
MAFSPGPLREVIVQIVVYALGLSISPSPLLFVTIFCTGTVHLALLPILWPPRVLQAAEAQIKETETLLHDEYARRKNTAMANISARGLMRLDVLQADVDHLSDRHRTLFHFCSVHHYLRIVYQLSRNSQRCLRNVKDLRINLEQKIRALDHTAFPVQTLPDPLHPATSSGNTV